MPSCHEMKKGEVYVCKDCGLELQVIKECKDTVLLPKDVVLTPQVIPVPFLVAARSW